MALNIIYQDETGRIITEEQKLLLTHYTVVTIENEIVKKKQWFSTNRDGDIKSGIEYFLHPSEDKTEIIRYYINSDMGIQIYFNNESKNGFNLWEWELHGRDGTLKQKGYSTYNHKNWEIMSFGRDAATKKMWTRAQKYFYGNQLPDQYDDLLLKFDYNADGSLDQIHDFNNTYDFGQGGEDLDWFLSHMKSLGQEFSWDNYSYFHSLTPYLPETKDL